MHKKRVLFFIRDAGGVSYYRIQTPAIELQRIDNNKDFDIEVLNRLDFNDPNTIEYLKKFDIIQYHRELVSNKELAHSILTQLKESGVKLVVDIDDYWVLHKNHPQFEKSLRTNHKDWVLFNIKISDYVTTTTELLANEIKKIRGDNNVFVFENGINPDWMIQFQDNKKKDPNNLIRITYMGGSTHLSDLKQLDKVVNILNSDLEIKNRFKINLAGWDGRGKTVKNTLNTDLISELMDIDLWNNTVINEINKSQNNIWKVKSIPNNLKEKYQNNMFIRSEVDIETNESVYFDYEKILTDNYSIIEDKPYYNWLMKFEINGKYHNESNFSRVWTKPSNEYAKVLDETDIVIAPLENNKFNILKSELKQTECWSRKLPIVCSDIAPYNVYGEHMVNCILIPDKKNNKKHWVKNLKKLILDQELRNKLGENLHKSFSKKFHLTNITKRRLDFYKKII